MEVGNQVMQLDPGQNATEVGEQRQNDVILQTPPRPAPNSAQTPEELPFGIMPEVIVPWHPPSLRPPVGMLPPPRGPQPPNGVAPPQGVK